ncbi:bifunctional phosphopantothenoylcysteine decarboxylase/phosphopantothenate--cysteine ligase CoaBC [Thioflexithrix psekupsensis]|uniref:Coenzyme A biosynthesis bifunctional protein CoaBC n=1 Tax=Thioflexithrix psekupsensis TaxID=1570016 RepID=A0A251X7I9_9GAMM|nr:bifunctional phosphopantothenoylcysteine decarboxylase/phosphopantothenate--cysteine ligase CoaBC [Thioflexithrix psekupsensis]OUD14028.1 bifunctional 4'-phosphopantothenoylcysteine decarboxylase/phosphopantothenoylcysteine synthetase [Thioflexithrix psekupsensis]
MQQDLCGKKIIVGIGGGIAAYKIPDLVRRLKERGANIKVVMTANAQAFITPLTLQAVSGERVYTHLLDSEAEAAMGHIELARWADLILIAPATADLLARLAYGHADDLLTTLCVASAAPLALAPAMNQQMWRAAVTQENYQRLQARGVHFFGPAHGSQACGDVGEGRLLEPLALVDAVAQLWTARDLAGIRILITAGPTREALDPVRFISNRSSGKMGYALAAAATAAGAEVTLVSGPVTLPVPAGVKHISVESAQDMYAATFQSIDNQDIFIGTAAVADYRPASVATQKMKKGQTDTDITLTLVRNPDILAAVAATQKVFTVGFAAETEHLLEHARQKLINKKINMIAANWVGVDRGFERDDNALTVLWSDGEIQLPYAPKATLAQQLIRVVIERYRQGNVEKW